MGWTNRCSHWGQTRGKGGRGEFRMDTGMEQILNNSVCYSDTFYLLFVVQLLRGVWLFVTPWTAACHASLVYHNLPEFAQTHVQWVSDAIQPSHHPLSPPSLPALSLSQHQGLSQWINSSHQVAKVLELQLQHQSFHWISRVDFLLGLPGLNNSGSP